MFRKALLITAIAIGVPTSAHADFRYSLTTSTGYNTPVGGTVFGSNPGDFNLSSATTGGLEFSQTSASWQTSPTLGVLNSTALTVTNFTAGTQTFTLMVSVNGLVAPPSPLAYASTVSGNFSSGSTGSSASFTSYFGSTGVLFGATNPIGFGPFNGASGLTAFGGVQNGPLVTYGADYSVTHEITVTLAAGSVLLFNFRTELTPVPEPATISAAFIGLSCLGLARFRRKSKV